MNNKNIGYLDGWRGLAITFLLIGHFFPYWRFRLGVFGVYLFFVLSGLLMTKLLFIKRSPISIFYRRRISRIFPALYVFIAATALGAFEFSTGHFRWDQVIGAALLVRNYFPAGWSNEVPLDHIWSLSVEEHSYIVLSLVAVFARKSLAFAQKIVGWLCVVMIGFGVTYSILFPGPNLYAHWLIHSEVTAFGIFSSAYLTLRFRDGLQGRIHPVVFPVLFLCAILALSTQTPPLVGLVLGTGCLALLVNILHKSPAWIQVPLSVWPLRWLGLASFSIYLWQQPFYRLMHLNVLTPCQAIVGSLLVGAISYICVERPVRSFLNRTWASDRDEAGKLNTAMTGKSV